MTGADASPERMLSVTKRYGLSIVLVLFALLATLTIDYFFLSKAVVPDISLIDPTTLTTMDTFLTACNGLDALTQAIEAYVSFGPWPLTDLHAPQVMRLVSTHLEKSLAEPLNPECRTNIMRRSLAACFAFSNASVGAVHAMSNDALF